MITHDSSELLAAASVIATNSIDFLTLTNCVVNVNFLFRLTKFMRTYEDSEVLDTGDIFDLKLGTGNEAVAANPVSYLVRGFKKACMHVSELGGGNRDGLVVLAKDIPEPETFRKWGLKKNLEGLTQAYAQRVLKALRGSLEDLRAVNSIDGAYTTINEGAFEDPFSSNFTTSVTLGEDGLFRKVHYHFGMEGGISPVLRNFDLDRFGIIPDRYRGSTPNSYSADIWDLCLDDKGAERIAAVAEKHGIQLYPNSYIGKSMMSRMSREPSVSEIEGRLRGPDNDTRVSFPDVKAAHSAVLDVHKGSVKKD